MARSVALVATLFAAASMLTPAIATNGIGASVDEYSGPPPYTSLPYMPKRRPKSGRTTSSMLLWRTLKHQTTPPP